MYVGNYLTFFLPISGYQSKREVGEDGEEYERHDREADGGERSPTLFAQVRDRLSTLVRFGWDCVFVISLLCMCYCYYTLFISSIHAGGWICVISVFKMYLRIYVCMYGVQAM